MYLLFLLPTQKGCFSDPAEISKRLHRTYSNRERYALHLAMQFVDLSNVDINSIESEIARLKSMEIISAEQADAVEPKKILGFIQSDLGRRMLASKNSQQRVQILFPR